MVALAPVGHRGHALGHLLQVVTGRRLLHAAHAAVALHDLVPVRPARGARRGGHGGGGGRELLLGIGDGHGRGRARREVGPTRLAEGVAQGGGLTARGARGRGASGWARDGRVGGRHEHRLPRTAPSFSASETSACRLTVRTQDRRPVTGPSTVGPGWPGRRGRCAAAGSEVRRARRRRASSAPRRRPRSSTRGRPGGRPGPGRGRPPVKAARAGSNRSASSSACRRASSGRAARRRGGVDEVPGRHQGADRLHLGHRVGPVGGGDVVEGGQGPGHVARGRPAPGQAPGRGHVAGVDGHHHLVERGRGGQVAGAFGRGGRRQLGGQLARHLRPAAVEGGAPRSRSPAGQGAHASQPHRPPLPRVVLLHPVELGPGRGLVAEVDAGPGPAAAGPRR